jgi:hypothetical protein
MRFSSTSSLLQFSSTRNSSKPEGTNYVAKIKPKRLYGEIDRTVGQSTILGKKSKDAAYRLLNNLIKKSPLLMNAFLEKSMVPLMSLIKRHDGWNYTPPGNSVEGK